MLLRTRKLQIWQSYSNTFRRTVESISLDNQKWWKTIYFLKKIFLLRMYHWTRRNLLWQLRLKTPNKCLKFFQSLSVFSKTNFCSKHFFLKSIFLLKKFFWTHKLQFWKPCRKVFARRPIIFFFIFKSHYKTFHLKVFRWTRKLHFWQLRQNFSRREAKKIPPNFRNW